MAIDDNTTYGLTGAQIKDQVAQIKKRAVSVGEDGSSHVEFADNIHTDSLSNNNESFIFRTTGGKSSLLNGEATLHKISGGMKKTTISAEAGVTTEESFAQTNSASMNVQDFVNNFLKSYWGWSDYDVEQNFYNQYLRINISSDYGGGNFGWEIWFGGSFFGSSDSDLFQYQTQFGLSLQDWGAQTVGDYFVITYQPAQYSYTPAKATELLSTGFNQYDATAGYAHVKGNNQYRIDGIYTSLGFTTTIGGTTAPVTVTNGKFTPTEDGYIYVTGGSGDILIALVWSGTRDNEPYEPYEESTVTIPTKDASNNDLPTATYGMPKVGNVADELDFDAKTYTQKIGYYPYSQQNLETVQALDVDYVYDTNSIFYVLSSPTTFTLSSDISGDYIANDYGTEWFFDSEAPFSADITYIANLVDKIRTIKDIQQIGHQLKLEDNVLSHTVKLTQDDYNYNINGTDCVAIWLLPAGMYTCSGKDNIKIAEDQYNAYTGTERMYLVGELTASNYRVVYCFNTTGTQIYGISYNEYGGTTGYSNYLDSNQISQEFFYRSSSEPSKWDRMDALWINQSNQTAYLYKEQDQTTGFQIWSQITPTVSDAAPTSSTYGSEGTMYIYLDKSGNTPEAHLYICTSATFEQDPDTSEWLTVTTWQEIGGAPL